MSELLSGNDLEEALLAYCKNASSAPDPAAVASDASFAKGIGGTKADHLAEKMMGEMLRDSGSATAAPGSTLFENWITGTSAAAVKAAQGKKPPPASEHSKGKWIRTLNMQGSCYLYIHTTTYQMQGTRPEDFVGGDDEGPAEDPFASFPSTHVDTLAADISKSWSCGKCPLLLCDGDEGYAAVKAALAASGPTAEVCMKPFVKGVVATKVKFADHVETARQCAIKMMKASGTLILDLSDVGTPNWKEKICNVEEYKKVFPLWMLDANSNKSMDKHGQVFKKDDKKDVGDKDWDEALEETIKGYRIVYLSSCGPGNYEKEIKLDFLPAGKWEALRVKRGVDTKDINLKSLVDAIDEAVNSAGMVPLLSDPTENTDTFLAFQSTQVIEMKALILSKGSAGLEGVREKMRQKLVAALKNGQTLLIRLTDTAPDLSKEYAADDFFPTEKVFECVTEELEEEEAEQFFGGFGGQIGASETAGVAGYLQPKDTRARSTKGVFGVQDKEWLQKVFREEEYEAGAPISRPGFRVVVTTNLGVDTIKDKLGALLPLSRCKVISVKAD
jgi:hypothetical protein